MGLFDHFWGRKSPRPTHQSKPRSAPLGLEALEDRTVLNATGSLAGGVLTVTGMAGPYEQIALVRDVPTDTLVLSDGGVETGRFSSAAVTSIEVNTASRFSLVRIAENVLQPATINGSPGTNHLFAGSGPTTLNAGPGTPPTASSPPTPGINRLAGGNNFDILNGTTQTAGNGVTTQFGGGASNALFASPGLDYFFGALDTSPVTGQDLGRDRDFRIATIPFDLQDDFLGLVPSPDAALNEEEVELLLRRAAAASASEDAIIAIVDRSGRILGVRVEAGVSPTIQNDPALLTFAIDGAVAKARTTAFFANNTGPINSRTIQFISQSTITQRMVESNPSIADVNSTVRGPGYVAPVGIGGNFPPGVVNTPQVDLFEIEGINRDASFHPGPSGVSGAADSIFLPQRFNVDPAFIPARIPIEQRLAPIDSYGVASGQNLLAQPRGVATLPGGLPIYKLAVDGSLAHVGGLGVFFPGETGFATEENSILSNTFDPTLPDRNIESEWIAFAALGGTRLSLTDSIDPTPVEIPGLELPVGTAPTDPISLQGLPTGRIDLVGITLPLFGPNELGTQGALELIRIGAGFGFGDPNSGANVLLLNPGADNRLATGDEVPDVVGIPNILPGTIVPEGWLVEPHDGVNISADQVRRAISDAVNAATLLRSPIRLPLDSDSSLIAVVTDVTGEVLGQFRMPDSLTDALDVTVAKARSVAYYANPAQLQPIDQVSGIPPGTALATRTFRFLAEPFFPEGINSNPPGPFSILLDGGVDPETGLNDGPPLPAIEFFDTVLGHDIFFPGTLFHSPFNILNQNGVIFFPGGVPLYANGVLIGGLGVSGEGVDQDDIGAFEGAVAFQPPPGVLRADEVFVAGIRLPYLKFNRQPLLQPGQV